MTPSPTDRPAEPAAVLDAQMQWAERVADRAARFRILSTLPYTKVPFWLRAVHTVPFSRGAGWRGRHGLPTAAFIFRLLAMAPRSDLVLLTGGERRDLVYSALAGLCFWIRTPHVIVDAHWQQATGWKHVLQKLLLRLGRRLVVQVQPHAAEEVPLYHRIFDIPLATLRPVPWSTSLIGFPEIDPAEAEAEPPFVLTGGISFRDYGVFLAAARLAGVRIKIGLPASGVTPEIRAAVADCPDVSLHTDWSNADYVRQMQLCRVFAMPIRQGLTRATADQTLLNAMHFGKVVVSTDCIGPRIYLRDGVSGFLVREPTPAAWCAALQRAVALPPDAQAAIARQARHAARVVFNEPLRLARTLAVALEVLAPGSGGDDAAFHFKPEDVGAAPRPPAHP